MDPAEPTFDPASPPMDAPARRAAPPTEPGALGAPRSTWPSVIGVLAIVFGGLGVVLAGIQAAAGLVVGSPGSSNAATGGPVWVSIAMGGMLAVWHIVAGSMVFGRRRKGPPALIAWAIADSVVVVGLGIATLALAGGANQGLPPGGAASVTAIVILSAVLRFVWQLIWPVFVVIWLARPKIRAEWKAWGRGGRGDALQAM